MSEPAPPMVGDESLVACLCAAWCAACRTFGPEFDAVARAWPGARFVWVDIEDEPDLLGDDLDIETFPTVLVADARGVSFYGVIEPRQSTLQALVAQAGDPTMRRPLLPDSVSGVAQRVRALADSIADAGYSVGRNPSIDK